MESCFFTGKKALIVGGTGGIGRSVSLLLAKNGADLVIHGSENGEKSASLAQQIHEISGEAPKIIAQNLTKSSFSALDSSQLLDSARNCDILCVCFSPFIQKPLHETSIDDWQQTALLDYALPGLLVSASLPNMMKKNWGRILLFGGTGTVHRTEFFTNPAYASAKSGLNVMVSSVAASYANYGINCNMILPGFTETEYLSDKLKVELSAKMPLGTLIQTQSIAETALFLLKNADINGAILRIDRGWTPLKYF